MKLRRDPSGNIAWMYQARRVATQANAAGGKVLVDIAVPSGTVARLVVARADNSGTNSIAWRLYDEDDELMATLGVVGSAGATNLSVPTIGTAPATNNNIHSLGQLIPPGAKFTAEQSGAGAQNDTLTIAIILLMSSPVEPTWVKTRSTNVADVTIAASTISAANTLQPVLI